MTVTLTLITWLVICCIANYVAQSCHCVLGMPVCAAVRMLRNLLINRLLCHTMTFRALQTALNISPSLYQSISKENKEQDDPKLGESVCDVMHGRWTLERTNTDPFIWGLQLSGCSSNRCIRVLNPLIHPFPAHVICCCNQM